MMKLKNLVENFALARYVLQRYPHDGDSLDRMLPRFRISSNAVYPYLDQGQLCFLRIAPLEEKDPASIRAEIEFIQYLRGQGYPAIRPIHDKDGQLTTTLVTEWGDCCVSSFAAVEGSPIEDMPLTPDIVRAYGRSLGQLHALSSLYEGDTARPAWDEAVNRQILLASGAGPEIVAACDDLFAALRDLPADPAGFGLIHYDFEPDNVFWSADHQCISVIDFDDCIRGWYAMDVAQALNELDAAWHAVFMNGYRDAFPFSEQQEAILPLMQQYIRLRSYARLKHCLSEEVPVPPEWMIRLRDLLQTKLDALEKAITA